MSLDKLNQHTDAPLTPSEVDNPKTEAFAPFTWHSNRFQHALQRLHNVEPAAVQVIVETMEEIQESNLFWKLMSSYTDAMEQAKRDGADELNVELAMFARMYLAGTQRGGDTLDGLAGADR